MDLLDALTELENCRHLKITASSVSAARFSDDGDIGPRCSVHVRRKTSEPFAEMLIRAAGLARKGHQPDLKSNKTKREVSQLKRMFQG